jgi:hypothetical protein
VGENGSIENVREALRSRGLDIQGKLQSGTGVNCRIARLCLSVCFSLRGVFFEALGPVLCNKKKRALVGFSAANIDYSWLF